MPEINPKPTPKPKPTAHALSAPEPIDTGDDLTVSQRVRQSRGQGPPLSPSERSARRRRQFAHVPTELLQHELEALDDYCLENSLSRTQALRQSLVACGVIPPRDDDTPSNNP